MTPRSTASKCPGILGMLDGVGMAAPNYGDRVEAIGQRRISVAIDPRTGHLRDFSALFPGDGFQWMTAAVAGACFDFDECDGVEAAGDNVDFFVTDAEVARDNLVAVACQEASGVRFG